MQGGSMLSSSLHYPQPPWCLTHGEFLLHIWQMTELKGIAPVTKPIAKSVCRAQNRRSWLTGRWWTAQFKSLVRKTWENHSFLQKMTPQHVCSIICGDGFQFREFLTKRKKAMIYLHKVFSFFPDDDECLRHHQKMVGGNPHHRLLR